MQQVIVLTGGFGSGKSELAINLALEYARQGPATLVDLDITNPYFRSREVKAVLAANGVKAVVPPDEWLATELPVLSPGLRGLLRAPAGMVVLDVGGEDMGAVVLGGVHAELRQVKHQIWLVVNPFRPFSQDVAGITVLCRRIEQGARIPLTGLFSNPNVGHATQLDHVLKGHEVVEQAAVSLGLPVTGLGVLAGRVAAWSGRLRKECCVPLVPLEIHLVPRWLQAGSNLI